MTLENRKTARITGILYLLLAVIGPFTLMYIPSKLLVSGDAAATANNILSNELLFRFGIIGETLIVILEVIIIVLIYKLFSPVNKHLTLTAVFSRLAMTVLQGGNIINRLLTLEVLNGTTYTEALGVDQVNAMVSLFLNGHSYGVYIWQIFFSIHLFVLGYMIFKSGCLPKLIGGLIIIGSLGYLMDSYACFIMPENGMIATAATILLALATVGEVAFAVWLLIKGINRNEFA